MIFHYGNGRCALVQYSRCHVDHGLGVRDKIGYFELSPGRSGAPVVCGAGAAAAVEHL